MTYCVAARVDGGVVFLSDTRTNAGVDQINTFRKMHVFEQPGERVMVLLTAGNLSISQSVHTILRASFRPDAEGATLWNASTMHDAAKVVGDAVRLVHARDAVALKTFNVNFAVSFLLGGQVRGEEPRLFDVYSAGNFIEATVETPYFQLGESKYGKPIMDRFMRRDFSLEQAAKCALISMESAMRSNLSIGMPLDLLCYERDSLRVTSQTMITETDPYYCSIRQRWGEQLRRVFEDLPDPPYSSQRQSDF